MSGAAVCTVTVPFVTILFSGLCFTSLILVFCAGIACVYSFVLSIHVHTNLCRDEVYLLPHHGIFLFMAYMR